MSELLREFGPAGFTLLVVMGLFSWLLRTVMAGFQAQIERFTGIIENHISHNTQATVELRAAIRELSEEIRRMHLAR